MFNLWICVSVVFIATCFLPANCFWFFSCPHGNGQGRAGDVCSVFCRCHAPYTCEAGIQRCALPGVTGDHCHATRPCAGGLSCHPGVQKCFHDPRRYGEPCVAGYECDSALSCEPGVQVRWNVKSETFAMQIWPQFSFCFVGRKSSFQFFDERMNAFRIIKENFFWK